MKQQFEEVHMKFFSHLVIWALLWYIWSVVLVTAQCMCW